jgi:SAM-dependent methyltransferase
MSDPTHTYYSKHAQAFCEETATLDLTNAYRPFLELVPINGRILDAGCGSGRDSLYFKRRGYCVTAFDNAEKLVKMASALLGAPVLHRSFAEIDFDGEFDGVWACASLLHVPKADMPAALARLLQALKPSGVLYASFKWGHKEEIRKGRLFNDYTENSLRSLLDEMPGTQPVRFWKASDTRPERRGEYWLNALLKKSRRR